MHPAVEIFVALASGFAFGAGKRLGELAVDYRFEKKKPQEPYTVRREEACGCMVCHRHSRFEEVPK